MIPAYNHYDLLKKVTDINLKKKININQINKISMCLKGFQKKLQSLKFMSKMDKK